MILLKILQKLNSFKLKKNKIIDFILWILLFILSINFIYLIILFFSIISNNIITLDFGEGFVLEAVWRLKNDLGLYNDFSQDFNNLVAFYPPVFFYYLLLVNKVSGLGININLLFLANGITLSLLGVLIYKVVNLEVKCKKLAVISSLLFFTFFYIFLFPYIGKVDLLAALLNLFGVYLFLKFYNDEKKIYLCLFPFVLAFFTKLTTVVLMLALLAYLFVSKKKNLFVNFSFIYFSLLSIIFLIINHKTNNLFYKSVFEIHDFSEYSSHRVISFVASMIFIIILGSLISSLLLKQKLRWKFWLILFIFLLIGDFLLSGKAGSGFNYFMELLILISIIFGISFNDLLVVNKERFVSYITIIFNNIAFVIVSIILFFSLNVFFSHNTISRYLKYTAKNQNELNSFFQVNQGKKILSESSIFNVINNKHEDIYEFFLFSTLINHNQLDQNILLEKLKNEYYYVVLTTNIFDISSGCCADRFNDKLITSIKNNFYLKREIKNNNEDVYYIFEKL